jgi:hypothetical protein
MRRSMCQRRTVRLPCRLRHVPQQRLHGRGEGAYRAFVRSFFIFITEIVGGPQGTTERCRVRADIMADEAVSLEINAIPALLPIHNTSGPKSRLVVAICVRPGPCPRACPEDHSGTHDFPSFNQRHGWPGQPSLACSLARPWHKFGPADRSIFGAAGITCSRRPTCA